MSGTRNRVSVTALTLVMVLSAVTVGATAPALADDDPPEAEALYHGTVTVDGEPAPEGTTVTAVVDGERRGTVVVDEPGQYGKATVGGDHLTVPGSTGDGEVTFLVNGEEAETDPETVQWESGDLRQVNLSATDVGTPSFAVEIDEDASNTSVAPNGTATVVADIENVGDGFGERTVEFAVDGELRDTVEGVQLEPGESIRVSFATELEGETTVDATVSTLEGTATVTLSSESDDGSPPGPILPGPGPAPGPSDFEVIDAELGADEVRVGRSVAVTATVENTGPTALEAVELLVDGDVEAEQRVRIEEGATEEVTFYLTLDEPGTYEVAVGEFDAGTLTVVDPSAAEFEFRDARLSATEVAVDETVEVTATVENVGESSGTTTAELLVDGEVVAERDVTVDGGASETVTFEHAFDEPGEYEVAVSSAAAGTVTVVEEDDDGDSIPGFGVTTAIAALLVAHLVLRRR